MKTLFHFIIIRRRLNMIFAILLLTQQAFGLKNTKELTLITERKEYSSQTSTVIIENSLFRDINSTGLQGGALSIVKSSVTIKGCQFHSCLSSLGGAINIQLSDKKLRHEINIQDTEFKSCAATKNGGAILINNQADNKTITISNCVFSENSANNGGAIHITNKYLLTIEGCTFDNNVARIKGASLYSTFGTSSGNGSNDIFVLRGNNFTFEAEENQTNVYIKNAKVSSASTASPTLQIGGCTFSSESSVTIFKHLEIEEVLGYTNTAFANIIFDSCNCVKQERNTFDVPSKYLNNTQFGCKSIETCSSNVQPPNPDTPDEGSNNRIPNDHTYTVIDIANTTFHNLIAEKENGGAICIGSNKVNLSLTKCIFQGCSSLLDGGAISVTYATIKNQTFVGRIYNCQFNVNTAKGRGGAVYVYTTQPRIYTFTFEKCTFKGNKAKTGGGVCAIVRDLFTLSGCTFNDNQANESGSSIYLKPGWDAQKDKNNTIVVEKNVFQFSPSETNRFNVRIETNKGNSSNVILTFKSNKFIARNPIDEYKHIQILTSPQPYQDVIFAGCNCVQQGPETAEFAKSVYPITNFSFGCNTEGSCLPEDPWELPPEQTTPDPDGFIPHNRIDDEGKDINLEAYKFTELDAGDDIQGGGAIKINDHKVSCILTNCTFTSCHGKSGGALFVNFAGSSVLSFIVKASRFNKCQADTHGGAIFLQTSKPKTFEVDISSCTFISNKAGKNGGALYLIAVDKTAIESCTFENNQASIGSSIWLRVGFNQQNHTDLKVSLSDNIFKFSPNVNSTNVYIENSKINKTKNSLNAVLSLGLCRFISTTNDVNKFKHLNIASLGDGFQTISFPDCVCVADDESTVSIPDGYRQLGFTYDCHSYDTCAADNEGYKYHGRIEDEKRNESIILDEYKFKNLVNDVDKGGAITINKQRKSLTISKCKFDSCRASMGGAVFILYAGTAENYTCSVTNTIFIDNEAASNGGAFYCEITKSNRHSLTFSDCTYTANKAGKNGGALYAMARDRFTLQRCTFTQNTGQKGEGSSVWLRVGYNEKYFANKAVVLENKFTFTPGNKKSVNVHIETFPLNDGETPNANLEFGNNEFIVESTAIIGYLNLEINPLYSAFDSITFSGCNCIHDLEETVFIPYPYSLNAFNFNCKGSSSCKPSQPKPSPVPDNEGYTPSERIQLKELPSIRLTKTKFTGIECNLTGGALSLNKINFTITDCKFVSCKCTALLNGNNDGGGAIFIQYSTKTYFYGSLVSCQFTNCETTSQGGALNIKINQAKYHTVNIEGCTFTNNKAANYGGAIYSIARDRLTIQHSTFTNNEALNGSSLWIQVGWHEGTDLDDELVLFNNKFIFKPSETNPINVYIQSNTLKNANIVPNANLFIGLCSFEGEKINGANHKHLVIAEQGAFQSVTFTDCNCLQGESNTVTITTTVETNTDNLKFDCSNMDKCTGGDGEQPPVTDECQTYPARQEIFGQTNSFVKSCFYNMKSTRDGGAARIVNANLTLNECRFINCSSDKSGGALYVDFLVDNCLLTTDKCKFENCQAELQGGAYYFSNAFPTLTSITNCVFTSNNAQLDGGALYYSPCEKSTLSSCLFVDNKCSAKQTIHGSAVYILVENLNAKSGKARLNAEDEPIDTDAVIISGNKIRSQPVSSTQQMYINVKKSGNVRIHANSFSFNGANVTTASSKYLQVASDDGASIEIVDKLCVDHDGSKNLITGADFEVDYNCHKADQDHDDEFAPVPTRGKKSNTGMIIGIVIAVVVVIVIVVVVVILVKKKSSGDRRNRTEINSDGLVDDDGNL